MEQLGFGLVESYVTVGTSVVEETRLSSGIS